MPWICPLCKSVLQQQQRQLVCCHAHSFDIAREGYVNLLPSHHKRSGEPGDDKHMLTSRRTFLEHGYYQPLADRLASYCGTIALNGESQSFTLLDTGCGEGYYTRQIAAAVTQRRPYAVNSVAGIDISKHAVRMAARNTPQIDYAVASNAAIPLADQSVDCVVRVFAPGYAHEVIRILRPGGWLVSVVPGPRHLRALRRLVYDQPREHAPPETACAGMHHVERQELDFEISVSGADDVGCLLSMTPYFWQANRDKQAAIASLQQLDTEVAFVIDAYRLE